MSTERSRHPFHGRLPSTLRRAGLFASVDSPSVWRRTGAGVRHVEPGVPDDAPARTGDPARAAAPRPNWRTRRAVPWHAAPILVSGNQRLPRRANSFTQDTFSTIRGGWRDPHLPTDPRYAADAADLVEFRLETDRSGLLIRLTYNAMIDPKLVASTIALGDSAHPSHCRSMPERGNRRRRSSPCTARPWRSRTPHRSAGARARARASVDLTRRQVTITVPRDVFDTHGMSTLRVSSASGLWDATDNQYLQPCPARRPRQRRARGTAGSALFNVAFRVRRALRQRHVAGDLRDSRRPRR